MTDLSQMIRWNANFVRGLAQSVLERAKVIRTSLAPYTGASTSVEPIFPPEMKVVARPTEKKKITVQRSAKRGVKKPLKGSARKSKRTNA